MGENSGCRKDGTAFQRLVDVVSKLRRECPWDREQTNESIKNNLIEEAYELFEAIESGNREFIIEELGDVLLQVLFHSRIKEDLGEFDIVDVVNSVTEKLIRRHPHVFGGTKLGDSDSVLKQWEDIKREEKNRESLLDGVPKRMPALLRAQKIQKKLSKVGFDWENVDCVWDKLFEEIEELKKAVDRDGIEHELGDVLFTAVNLGRFMGVDVEGSLHKAIDRVEERFRYMEEAAQKEGKRLENMTLDDMETLWQEAKVKKRCR